MTLQEWRERRAAASAEEAVKLTLPSGLEIKARRPSPLQYAMWERLPLELARMAGEPDAAAAMSDEDAVELARRTRELIEWCWVAPRLGSEIQPREIPDEDLNFVLGWAMRLREVDALRSFRGQRENGDRGNSGEGVRAAAVGSARD